MMAAGFLFVFFGSIFLIYLIISTLLVSFLATPLLILGLPILLIYLAVVVFSPSTYTERHPWKRRPILHGRQGLPDGSAGRMVPKTLVYLILLLFFKVHCNRMVDENVLTDFNADGCGHDPPNGLRNSSNK